MRLSSFHQTRRTFGERKVPLGRITPIRHLTRPRVSPARQDQQRRLHGHCGSLPSSGPFALDPIDLPSCTLESRSLALRDNWTAAGMLCIGHQRRGIGNIVAGLPSTVVAGLPAGAVWIKPYRIDPMGFCLFNRSQRPAREVPTIWRIQIFYRFLRFFHAFPIRPPLYSPKSHSFPPR